MRWCCSPYLFWVFLACCASGTAEVQADVVRLAHGGELRGQLQGPGGETFAIDGETLSIRTLAGTLVTLPRTDVAYTAQRSPVVEEYVTRSRQVPDTIEGHLELADWCHTHRLQEEREEQLLQVLEIDPDHVEVRRLLGHVQERGQWMTRDEMMTSRGYVKHKGKWITRQELSLIEKNAEQRKAELEWYPKVRLWHGWLTGRDRRRSQLALEELSQVMSPDAIPALVNFMSDDAHEEVRMLMLAVLGRIGTAEVVGPVIEQYLHDVSEPVRRRALESLPPDHYSEALPALIAALQHELNPIVRRAAVALGTIGDPLAVPALIDALVTSHRFRVEVPASGGISIGTMANGQAGVVDPRAVSSTLPPDIAMLGRAGQLPYGVTIQDAFPASRPPKYTTVRVDIQNDEVLSALQKLTGQNLGFHERDWQLWWALNQG